jgi:hypothetical protein
MTWRSKKGTISLQPVSRDETRYLVQTDSNRVIALDRDGNEAVVLSGAPFEHLVLTQEKVVAKDGFSAHRR